MKFYIQKISEELAMHVWVHVYEEPLSQQSRAGAMYQNTSEVSLSIQVIHQTSIIMYVNGLRVHV